MSTAVLLENRRSTRVADSAAPRAALTDRRRAACSHTGSDKNPVVRFKRVVGAWRGQHCLRYRGLCCTDLLRKRKRRAFGRVVDTASAARPLTGVGGATHTVTCRQHPPPLRAIESACGSAQQRSDGLSSDRSPTSGVEEEQLSPRDSMATSHVRFAGPRAG